MSKGGQGKEKRTALLIRCTNEEAEAIRNAAGRERRTVSSFVLNAVMNRIAIQNRTREMVQKVRNKPPNTD